MVKLTISSGSRQKWRLEKRGRAKNYLSDSEKFDQTNLRKKPFTTLKSDEEH